MNEKLIEQINLAIEKTSLLKREYKIVARQNLTDLRDMIITNHTIDTINETFYINWITEQTPSPELNVELNLLFHLFCNYLFTSNQIDNTMQK
jgi:hypothetical protein